MQRCHSECFQLGCTGFAGHRDRAAHASGTPPPNHFGIVGSEHDTSAKHNTPPGAFFLGSRFCVRVYAILAAALGRTRWDARVFARSAVVAGLALGLAWLVTAATDEGGVSWGERAGRTLPLAPACAAIGAEA